MVIFYKKWKKYNEIQLTKSKMDLNIRKMTNHPPSPGSAYVDASSLTRPSLHAHAFFQTTLPCSGGLSPGEGWDAVTRDWGKL